MTKAKPAKTASETDEAEDKAPARAKKAKPAEEGAEPQAPAAKARAAKPAADGAEAKTAKGKKAATKAKRDDAAPEEGEAGADTLDELDTADANEAEELEEVTEEAEIPDEVFEIESDDMSGAEVPVPDEEKFPVKRSTGAPAPVSAPPPREEPKPAVAFSNLGVGVRTASKKPILSVAPGVMIQGRAPVAKPEETAKPMERKLSKEELAKIKTHLIERRERLLAATRRELALQRERAENKAADEVDKATDAYDEDLSFEIAAANDQELEEIRVALEKIERGTYGECEVCGCNISPSRLKVLPSATTCVACRGQEELARRREETPSFTMLGGEDGEAETPEP